ncbi:endolytic transglycosylase MltG [Enterobacteriaceae endosymbiont of Neohaemonia nigricornis]|uniref:endolytic transglycosylase MltG n=1 Tax=Enterobacteriaceae endosymbiont of Neohaemonia nigricornis TaxID=2675792 RepID=UPI00144A20CF|nr:endolytic transglycosylase MltG [Enterobacteriaceae endosymbiont of Neohaemonia nigricornis]QJC30285.1 endolytic transglycosylase MltG [Enterobacteriaceae endosymbiont of Neohaemonia nigricornis]
MPKFNINKIIYTIFYIIYVIILHCFFQLYGTIYSYINVNQKIITYIIPPGRGVNNVLYDLQKKHIINKNIWLYLFLQLQPYLKNFKANIYHLKPHTYVINMLELFNSNKETQYAITLLEGETLQHFLKRLNENGYIKHTFNCQDIVLLKKKLNITDDFPLEGRFAPNTYFYNANTTDLELLQSMYCAMKNNVKFIWEHRAKNLPYKNIYDLIITASIIEKETSNKQEKKIIASVLVNRLKNNIKLQIDSTIIYGMNNNFNLKLLPKMLKHKNKYNTYIILGLPPSAIATPSISSLEAAAHPIKSNFLYFVANNNHTHIFTENFNAHRLIIKQLHKKSH